MIAVLRAEWAFLNRPDRVETLSDAHLPDIVPMRREHLARFEDLPERPPNADEIGAKLPGAPASARPPRRPGTPGTTGVDSRSPVAHAFKPARPRGSARVAPKTRSETIATEDEARAPAAVTRRPGFVGRLFPPARRQEPRARRAGDDLLRRGLFAVIGGRLVMLGVPSRRRSAARGRAASKRDRRRSPGHPRPQRRDPGDRHSPWSRSSPSRATSSNPDEATELLTAGLPPTSTRRSCATTSRTQAWLHLGEAPKITPAPAGGGARARHPRRRLPAREQAGLSQRRRGSGTCSASPTSTTSAFAGIEQWIDRQNLVAPGDAITPRGKKPELAPVRLSIESARPACGARRARPPPWRSSRRSRPRGSSSTCATGEGDQPRLAAGLRPQRSRRCASARPDQPDQRRRLTRWAPVMKAVTTATGDRIRALRHQLRAPTPAARCASAARTISDYRGENRPLTMPEVFIHSSNVGTARMALALGAEAPAGLPGASSGCSIACATELAESAAPLVPARWGEINTATISFGARHRRAAALRQHGPTARPRQRRLRDPTPPS